MIDSNTLISIIDQVAPGAAAANLNDPLSELGLDSLSILNVIIAAADQFALDLTHLPEDMSAPDTIASLLGLLNALPPAAAAVAV